MSSTKIEEYTELSQQQPVLTPPEVEEILGYVVKQKDQLSLVGPNQQLDLMRSISRAERILQRNWIKTHPTLGIPILREESSG